MPFTLQAFHRFLWTSAKIGPLTLAWLMVAGSTPIEEGSVEPSRLVSWGGGSIGSSATSADSTSEEVADELRSSTSLSGFGVARCCLPPNAVDVPCLGFRNRPDLRVGWVSSLGMVAVKRTGAGGLIALDRIRLISERFQAPRGRLPRLTVDIS